jgi:hypothetical protein
MRNQYNFKYLKLFNSFFSIRKFWKCYNSALYIHLKWSFSNFEKQIWSLNKEPIRINSSASEPIGNNEGCKIIKDRLLKNGSVRCDPSFTHWIRNKDFRYEVFFNFGQKMTRRILGNMSKYFQQMLPTSGEKYFNLS